MRRGCIAIEGVECDSCHRAIKYGERYLLINGEENERERLCVDCCERRGYISYGTEKGKDIASFLPRE
jgi:hypothetical protein